MTPRRLSPPPQDLAQGVFTPKVSSGVGGGGARPLSQRGPARFSVTAGRGRQIQRSRGFRGVEQVSLGFPRWLGGWAARTVLGGGEPVAQAGDTRFPVPRVRRSPGSHRIFIPDLAWTLTLPACREGCCLPLCFKPSTLR